MAICHNDAETDRIFGAECLSALEALNCFPVMPLKFKALRSIVLRKVDDLIYESDVSGIRDEVNKRNSDVEVVEVFKFPNSKNVKLTFSNQHMAALVVQRGIKIFNLHIGCADMQREEFIDVQQCFRCFCLNEHKTEDCSKPPDYLVCSKCSSLGHGYRDCRSDHPQCLNCNLSHPATSFSCPNRKKIIESVRNSRNMTYNSAVKHNSVTTNSPVALNTDQVSKCYVASLLCITVASRKEKESPGSFALTLSYLQKINRVPKFELGDIILSDYEFLMPEKCHSTIQEAQMIGSASSTNQTCLPPCSILSPSSEFASSENGEEPAGKVGGACGQASNDSDFGADQRQFVTSPDGSGLDAAQNKSSVSSIRIVKSDDSLKSYPSNIESLFKRHKMSVVP